MISAINYAAGTIPAAFYIIYLLFYNVMTLPVISLDTHMDIPGPWLPYGLVWKPKRS